jgi:hypothetical protein
MTLFLMAIFVSHCNRITLALSKFQDNSHKILFRVVSMAFVVSIFVEQLETIGWNYKRPFFNIATRSQMPMMAAARKPIMPMSEMP